MSPPIIDMTGQRFGRLLVLRRGVPRQKRGAAWVCRCDCGATTTVHRTDLMKGSTRSCGCLKIEMAPIDATRHGQYRSPTHRSWQAMRHRCIATSGKNAKYYAARGIRCCARWDLFENFVADMGERPPGMTLDRIDGTRGYEPGNCRWATRKQQAMNRRPARQEASHG